MKPKHFCCFPKKFKAFVLGCDPSNNSDNGKRADLEYVFVIGQDGRYFRDILAKPNLIGLHMEDIYIQNLITDYQDQETGSNKDWENAAKKSLSERIKEFDEQDPRRDIPVLVTAERPYNFLLADKGQILPSKNLYTNARLPVAAELNKLGRPIFPFFRHHKYKLTDFSDYAALLKAYFEKT